MAITRTAKGTNVDWGDGVSINSVTVASVAIASGASVIVLVAAHTDFGAVSSVTWNGQSLTQDVEVDNTNGIRTAIYSKHGISGATGDVVVTMTNTLDEHGIAAAVLEVTEIGVKDKTSSGTGNSTSPSSGATATTTAADEFLVGLVGMETAIGVGGSWGGSFSDGQSAQSPGAFQNAALSEGYRVVSSTGAYTASKSLATLAEWAACVATYKANQLVVTPAAVSCVGEVVATTILRAVLPAALACTGVVVAPTLVRAVTPAAVECVGEVVAPQVDRTIHVEALECAGEFVRPDLLGSVPDSFSPAAVTSQSFAAVRPTTPANLGDANATTTTTYRQGAPQATGVAEVKATVMSDVPPEQQFPAISYLVFRAFAWIADVGPSVGYSGHTSWPGWPTHPGTRMAWKVGGVEAQAPLVNDHPTIGAGYADGGAATGFVLVRDADGVDPGEAVALDHVLHTGNITTQPNGQPWDWAAVNALADVCVRWSWAGASPAFDFADLDVAEIWAEVYGPQGSFIEPIRIRVRAGNFVRIVEASDTAGG